MVRWLLRVIIHIFTRSDVMVQPRYSKEETGRKGREIYRQLVEPQMGEELRGKIVAVDIDTGEFAVGDKVLDATGKLRARLPEAQIWCERVGYPAVYKFGLGLRADKV
jgi:hypothetical protein